MSSLTVHHLENSRSQRLLWLLEELELDYEIVHYPRNPKTMRAPPELKKLHPLGKSPVLTHGDIVLVESGAIMEYVVEELGEGQMRPTDPEALRRYRMFLHFAEGSMMAPLLLKLVFNKLRGAVPLLGSVIANKVDATFTDPELRSHMSFLESELEGREWLAGELSAADVLISYPVKASIERGGDLGTFPNLEAYVARIEARPAYQRALVRGQTSS